MNNNKGSISAALLFALIVFSITLAMLAVHSDLLKVQRLRQQRHQQLNNIYQQTILHWHELLSELAFLNGQKKDCWSKRLTTIKTQFPETVHFPIATSTQQETALTKIHLNFPDQPLHSTLTLFTKSGNFDLTEIPLILQPSSNNQRATIPATIKINPDSLPILTPISSVDLLNDFFSSKLYAYSWLAIRKLLHLPPSNDPLPPGIYLFQEKEEIDLIFIQSAHSRLEFFTDQQEQKLLIFLEDQSCHQLSWTIDSGNYQLIYENKSYSKTKRCPFLIFNGSIEINQMHLLNEFQATITAFGLIVIDLKETTFPTDNGRLMLICRPINPFSGKIERGDIVLKNREELTLNLNLLTEGKFENHSTHLKLNGSLLASEVDSKSILTINSVKFALSYFQLTDIFLITSYQLNFLWED